jgi:phosphoglycolate phosphatase
MAVCMTVIVFDLDGTLVDSAPDIHAVTNHTLAHFGRPPLPFAQVRSFIGHGASHLLSQVIAAQSDGVDPALHAEMLTFFLHHYETAVTLSRLYHGVPETLERLTAQGHRLGLCTNKPIAPTRHLLTHFGLEAYFPIVMGGDSLPQRKPDPAPLLATFAALGGVGVFVGDSEVDAETAARAACPFLLFTEGYRKAAVEDVPHFEKFNKFDDLPGIVAAMS